MRGRTAKSLAQACRWLALLPIAGDDTEAQILRLFALATAGAAPARLRPCADQLAPFTWYQYPGDPLAAIVAHRALTAAGSPHAALAELASGYRAILLETPQQDPLLSDLLELPVAARAKIALPGTAELVGAEREDILEICRRVTMATSAGARAADVAGPAGLLPLLAFSYARDWDLQAACALLRASVYFGLSDEPACRFTLQWILDQQNEDGSFGLLRAEAARSRQPADDWRRRFDRTVHAVWALKEVHAGPAFGRVVGPTACGARA
jgi:hypothetical protein